GPGARHPPMRLHALELALELLHALADHATVGLELRLARAPRTDAAAEALEMLPLADEPWQQICELRELDLQLALRAPCALGEDVEDERGAVDHRCRGAPSAVCAPEAARAGRGR